MSPDVFILTGIIGLLIVIEHSFKPRLDHTSNGDTILWYTSVAGERKYVFLHHKQ